MSDRVLMYRRDGVELWHGDVMRWLPDTAARFDVVVTDPPYGETSLEWDRWQADWPQLVARVVRGNGSMWCFGSMRMFLERNSEFAAWRFVQDLVWEKHNGSNTAADRFRRVHEHALHFVLSGAKWGDVHKAPQFSHDAVRRQVRRKSGPEHWGSIGAGSYVSEDGGPRLMRSVLAERSCHGRAVHPTQKPESVIEPLLRYSAAPGAAVLDPFAGSGTTLVVARRLGLRCTGFEANRDYAEAAAERLAAELPLTEGAA